MAAPARPVSLFLPPSSAPSAEPLAPLRRPRSPPIDSFNTKRLSSYSFDPPDLKVSRRHSSILRSVSSMAFGFSERSKCKDPHRTVSEIFHKPAFSTSPRVASKLRSASSPTDIFPADDESPSTRFFRPRTLKTKRSLASLLTTNPDSPPTIHLETFQRTKSSETPRSFPPAPLSKTPRPKTAELLDLRKEEYRQLSHNPLPRKPHPTITRKPAFAEIPGARPRSPLPEVVYMQAYDPILLENDRYTNLLLRRLNTTGGPSFHDYWNKPPSTVLDVGCGSGQWLLDAASAWPNSLFTGFDLVNVLIPEASNHKNIVLTRGNFLRSPWPFPKQSFDLVRMANLSLCIPYDKWEIVLSEAQRVLAFGGRLEIIDDQVTFPYAANPPAPSPHVPRSLTPPRHVSFWDDDDDYEILEDADDTASSKTSSTLVGDHESSRSRSREGSPISDGDDGTHPRRLHRMPSPPGGSAGIGPLNSDLGFVPDELSDSAKTVTNIFPDRLETGKVRPPSWGTEVTASKDLETVFQGMLTQRYGIHARPADFLPKMMKKTFGNGRKARSYHLKLAPKDTAEVCYGLGLEVGEKEDHLKVPKVGEAAKEKEKKWLKKNSSKHSPTGGDVFTLDHHPLGPVLDIRVPSPVLDFHSSPGLDAFANPVVNIRVPDVLNAKAAGRLGTSEDLPKSASRPRLEVMSRGLFGDGTILEEEEDGEDTPTYSTIPSINQPTPSTEEPEPEVYVPERVGLKAASRLGISYSALTAAAAAASRRPLSSSSTLVSHVPSSSTPHQSPGLVLWPNTFIPLSPMELEMHACKHVHTLLGCRRALTKYVEAFMDENGKCLQTEEELNQSLWDYECFRRRRFNWPSDIPNWDVEGETTDLLDSSFKPNSGANKRHPPEAHPQFLSPPDKVHMPLYPLDQLTHVRSLRIYEAVKGRRP